MLKKLAISVISLLTVTLSFSQNSYPKKVIVGKDTTVIITTDQVIKINEIGYERDFYKEQNEIKENYILSLDQIIKDKDEKFNSLLIVNANLVELTDSYKKNVESLKRQLTQEQKKAKRNIYIGAGSAILTATIISLVK
jgi:hypothetical protein